MAKPPRTPQPRSLRRRVVLPEDDFGVCSPPVMYAVCGCIESPTLKV